MLFASFAHFQKSDFEMEILYSFTIEDTAKLVRQIGDKARSQSTVWNKMEWPKRKWLTNESSTVSQKPENPNNGIVNMWDKITLMFEDLQKPSRIFRKYAKNIPIAGVLEND